MRSGSSETVRYGYFELYYFYLHYAPDPDTDGQMTNAVPKAEG